MDAGAPVGEPIMEISGMDQGRFAAEVVAHDRPVVIRDAVAHWPAVQAAKTSTDALLAYFRRLDGGQKAKLSVVPAAEQGRFYFDPENQKFNFRLEAETVSNVLTWLAANGDHPDAATVYIQSLILAEAMPGFARENAFDWVPETYGPRLWLGNHVRTQTHFDPSYNLACVVAGRRRFTLFPPDQIENLYPGPFDLSPGNVPVSMVRLEAPDLGRYPRFTEALKVAQFAELGPGDAIFVPYAWWHHVQSLTGLNMLVNYWWNALGTAPVPFAALYAAILTIRDLPPEQRTVWKRLMDLYVFGNTDAAARHLPPQGRGILGLLTPQVIDRARTALKMTFGL